MSTLSEKSAMILSAAKEIFNLSVIWADETHVHTLYPPPEMLFQERQFISADAFSRLLGDMKPYDRYVMMDYFSIRWQLLRLEDGALLAGPYRSSGLVESPRVDIIQLLQLTDADVKSFYAYISSAPVIDDSVVLRIIEAAAGKQAANATFIDMQSGLVPLAHPEQDRDYSGPRPDSEFDYMREVKRGNAIEAKRILDNIFSLFRGKISGDNALLHSISTCAVYRTLARTAARQAGVPAALLDTVTNHYRQASIRLSKPSDQIDLNLAMTDELCRLVRSYQNSRYSEVIRNVIGYIDMYYYQELSVKEIADLFHIQQSQLSAQFIRETGMSLTDYITKVRLDYACSLLALSADPISTICLKSGIPDSSYFAKLFRKTYGMTPTEYRNGSRGKK